MHEQSATPTPPGYLVPCVFKAVQMLDAMRQTRSGLRVDDFVSGSDYSRSTVYRILRTLVACEYVVRQPRGYYCINPAVLPAAPVAVPAEPKRFAKSASGRRDEFERWGVRFHGDGSRASAHAGSQPHA